MASGSVAGSTTFDTARDSPSDHHTVDSGQCGLTTDGAPPGTVEMFAVVDLQPLSLVDVDVPQPLLPRRVDRAATPVSKRGVWDRPPRVGSREWFSRYTPSTGGRSTLLPRGWSGNIRTGRLETWVTVVGRGTEGRRSDPLRGRTEGVASVVTNERSVCYHPTVPANGTGLVTGVVTRRVGRNEGTLNRDTHLVYGIPTPSRGDRFCFVPVARTNTYFKIAVSVRVPKV